MGEQEKELVVSYLTLPSRWHNWVATLAGISGIGIGLFPMDPVFAPELLQKHPELISSTCYINHGLLGYHYIFVTIFFCLAFYLVFFRFSAFTHFTPTEQKIRRNNVYKCCSETMLVAMITIGFLTIVKSRASIFWPESVAVVAFAVAWQGQIVLKDVK